MAVSNILLLVGKRLFLGGRPKLKPNPSQRKYQINRRKDDEQFPAWHVFDQFPVVMINSMEFMEFMELVLIINSNHYHY